MIPGNFLKNWNHCLAWRGSKVVPKQAFKKHTRKQIVFFYVSLFAINRVQINGKLRKYTVGF